jgi:O-antigen/teichoic acid export membrane protein
MNLDDAKSMVRNSTIQMAQQLVTWASTFILILFLPRYLGPVEYGRIYLAGSIAGIFLIFIDFDGRTGIAKKISRNPENASNILVNAIGFRIMFWIVACIVLFIFALLTNYPLHVKILLLFFAVELVWLGSRTVLHGVFQGFELMQYSSYSSIAEKVFVSIGGITALFLGANSVGIGAIMVAGSLLGFLISVRFIKKLIHRIPKFDRNGSIDLIKEGLPLFLWTIFGVIYYRIDTIMLSLMTPEKVVGWYGAAYKFYDINFSNSI